MAKKGKRLINLYITPTAFNSLFKRISGQKVEDYDFSGIKELRQLLSNEKAKILHTIKDSNPESIYDLAKKVNRDFKSVLKDSKLLEKFGFISFKKSSKGRRVRLKPELEVSELSININF